MFFFDFSGEGENGDDAKVAYIATYSEQDIQNRTKTLQELGASCRFQKLPTGNYLFALDGMLLSDFNGLTPGSLGHILDAMIAHRDPDKPKAPAKPSDNAAVLKSAVEERKMCSDGLYRAWQKRMKEDNESSPGCSTKLVMDCARDVCSAVDLPSIETFLPDVSELSQTFADACTALVKAEDDGPFFKGDPDPVEKFRRVVTVGIFACIKGIGTAISDETAKRIFPMIRSFFPPWWKNQIAKELSTLAGGKRLSRHPDDMAFEDYFENWACRTCRITRGVLFRPMSLAFIMESLGPAYQIVETMLAPFQGMIEQLSPLEWRVASSLMEMEEMKR